MNKWTTMLYDHIRSHSEWYAPVYSYYREIKNTHDTNTTDNEKINMLSEFLMNHTYEEAMRSIPFEGSDIRRVFLSYVCDRIKYDQLAKKLYQELSKGE